MLIDYWYIQHQESYEPSSQEYDVLCAQWSVLLKAACRSAKTMGSGAI